MSDQSNNKKDYVVRFCGKLKCICGKIYEYCGEYHDGIEWRYIPCDDCYVESEDESDEDDEVSIAE
jgi:hypothetical protein